MFIIKQLSIVLFQKSTKIRTMEEQRPRRVSVTRPSNARSKTTKHRRFDWIEICTKAAKVLAIIPKQCTRVGPRRRRHAVPAAAKRPGGRGPNAPEPGPSAATIRGTIPPRWTVRFRRRWYLLRKLGRWKSTRTRGMHGAQRTGSLFGQLALRLRGFWCLHLAQVCFCFFFY